MLDYKDMIIKHCGLGLSGREIAKQFCVSKSGVNDFLTTFKKCETLRFPLPEGITNYSISNHVYGDLQPSRTRDEEFASPNFEDIHKQMQTRKNLTLTYLRNRYLQDCMDRALSLLQCAEQQFTAKPVIVMESTSHYHLILFQFFSDAGYEVIVFNPLQSNALKNINVRKIKTDKVDAYRLALLYRMNVLRRSQVPTEMLRSLRMLCRQHYELKGDITRYKNRLTALLDQTFPGFSKIFSDPAAAGALAVLEQYPHS